MTRRVALLLAAVSVVGLSVLALLLTGVLPPRASSAAQPVVTGAATGAATAGPTRSAAPSRSEPLQIVALGDSVPADTGCPCPGYVADLGTVLHALTLRPVTVHNDATGGWTTADVVADLASGTTPTDVAGADLVIVQVGANDFDPNRIGDPTCFPAATSACWQPTLTALRSGLEEIGSRIRSLAHSPTLRIAFVGYWNITVDGQVAASTRGSQYLTNSNELTAVVNATIADAAAATHSIYVDAYTPFKGENGSRDPTEDLLEDGDHPNASGNEILTEAVQQALVATGAVRDWAAH